MILKGKLLFQKALQKMLKTLQCCLKSRLTCSRGSRRWGRGRGRRAPGARGRPEQWSSCRDIADLDMDTIYYPPWVWVLLLVPSCSPQFVKNVV